MSKKEYRRKYYLAHKEQEKAYQREFYAQNRKKILAKLNTPKAKEKRRSYHIQHRITHRTQLQTYMKVYQQRPSVKAHRRIKQIDWRKEHENEYKEHARKYYTIPEVHERYLAHSRKHRKTEKGLLSARYYNEKRRERKLRVTYEYTRAELLEKISKTKGFCPYCKHPFTKQFHSRHELTLDHNPPISKAQKGFVYTIKDINIICRSCNAKKGNHDWVILDNESEIDD